MRTDRRVVALLALVALLPAFASAGTTVIYSEIASSSTSDVPGLPGVKFDGFDRPYRSPDGSYWALTAGTDLGFSEDEVLVFGSGVSGAVTIREGTPAPWAPGENTGSLDTNLSINNAGQYVFATNTDGPSTADEYIVLWDGANFVTAAQEGQGVPGIAGETYGSYLLSANIDNSGAVGWKAYSTNGGLPSDQDDFLIHNGTVLAQAGNPAYAPTGQGGGGTENWGNFGLSSSADFYVSTDGNTWVTQGSLTGSSDFNAVFAVNNDIKVQEGYTIGDFTSPVESIVEGIGTPGGDWYVRGDNDDQQDWVVRNGDVIARTGDAVPGGFADENFSDVRYSACFFAMTGNDVGDFVYGAVTDYVDEDLDAVIVLNNESVLLRQGDPVDVDGNGAYDDDAYIDIFNNDDSFLTNDGWYYFTADLRDGAGSGIGQAFMRVQIPEPTTLGLVLVGALALLRRR